MDSQIQTLNLKNKVVFEKWKNFLLDLGISNFSKKEISSLETTFGIYNSERELVAVGSVSDNVLKYIAVCNKGSERGSRFNKMVSALMAERAQVGKFHLFVFTKAMYVASFRHIGFKLLAETKQGGILETGDHSIQEYLNQVPRIENQDRRQIAGIVMNANPFTKGHRALVEKAADENDLVYVFVVENDVSLFSTSERKELVQQGLADLTNVKVLSGGDYMVSYVTFPAYFLPADADAIDYQTTLDARIFKEWIARQLNIRRRYVGSEPLSRTTNRYNQTLKRELPPEIEVRVMSRITVNENFVTATQVRKWIAEGQIKRIRQFVPEDTCDFIVKNLLKLQQRIEKGMNINGN